MRKLFAAALAVSLPLAALAQAAAPAAPAAEPAKPAAAAPAPLVQVYGTLNVNLQYTEASGSTAGDAANVSPRFAVSTDSTNVGVRGSLELSHGYKGVYQCETQANLDGEDTRALCNRNSRVGLQSFWGTLFYGNWDTPFKSAHYGTKADDPFGNTDAFGFNSLMGSPGYGVRSSAFNSSAAAALTASFDQRGANSIAYWSPKIAGLVSAKVQYSMPELRSQNGTVSPQLLAAAVNFDMGNLSAYATVEWHEDTFGLRTINATGNAGATTSSDLAWRVGAGYDIPLGVATLNVMAMIDQLMYAQDDATAGFKDYSRMAWLLGGKVRFGNHEIRARFSQALDPNITAASGTTLAAGAEDELGATNYAVGYAYHFAKSTQVYVFGTQIANDDRARYTFPVGGAAAVVAANTPAGSDVTAYGAGIRLAF
jgi:hypothetical protein